MVVKAVQGGYRWEAETLSGSSLTTSSARPSTPHTLSDSSDSLQLSSTLSANRTPHTRAVTSINKAIEAVHVAAESVQSIEQFVEGIGGLAEIASSEAITPRQTAILEIEGVELRQAIAEKAQSETSTGLKPLGGDPIRVELERTLAPVLELIFPDERKSTLGIDRVSFSSKEMILATVSKIEAARQRIQELRGAVQDGLEQLNLLSQGLNPGSVADVDKALFLGWDIKEAIVANSDVAAGSHSTADRNLATLLGTVKTPT